MDMQFDQFGGTRKIESTKVFAGPKTSASIGAPPATAIAAAPLDWPSLSARLVAAHATRRSLPEQFHHRHAASGSFAPALAPAISACLAIASGEQEICSSWDVNQNIKSDRKTPGTIEQNSMGKGPTTVRGLL